MNWQQIIERKKGEEFLMPFMKSEILLTNSSVNLIHSAYSSFNSLY